MRFKGTPKISFFPKPWSSEFETDGPVELLSGTFHVKKTKELRTRNAQLTVDPMETLESSDLKPSIGARSAHCLGSETLNAPILTSL